MAFLTPQKFRDAKKALVGKSFQDNKELLMGVGIYYREAAPSEIDLTLTLEIEAYLNEVYLLSQHEFITFDLQEMIRKMIGLSGAISFAIKNRNFDTTLFENFKKLGEILVNISQSI